LGGALSAKVSAVSVDVNSASGLKNGVAATAIADWTPVGIGGLGTVQAFALAGTIDSLSIADVITGSGKFSVAKNNVDANGLTGARALGFTLTEVKVSTGFGVSLAFDTLTVATLQPSAADVLAGDTREWSALKLSNASGTLDLGGALSAKVSAVSVEVHSASGLKNGVAAVAIADWT